MSELRPVKLHYDSGLHIIGPRNHQDESLEQSGYLGRHSQRSNSPRNSASTNLSFFEQLNRLSVTTIGLLVMSLLCDIYVRQRTKMHP